MMIRVLQKTATLGPGGIQTFLVNVQSNLNGVIYDYYLNTLEPDFFTNKVLSLESKIYGRTRNNGNPISKVLKRYILFYKTIKDKKYYIVHINETVEMTALSVIVAKLAGAKVIIAHAHNDHASERIAWFRKRIINPISRFINSTFATDHFACSKIAAEWFFTKRVAHSNKTLIVNNGIQPEMYSYTIETEKEYRKKLNLGNSFVLGHVGRFYPQKNHEFILDVFRELKKMESNSKLLLIGDGELKDSMKQYAFDLEILDDVIFYGVSNEVNKLIQTFNAFIFPSRFEGLGIVAIEAQAASLHTFCAEETIAKEVDITEFCHYIPLAEGAKAWAKEILEIAKFYKKRNMCAEIIAANYDITSVALMLQNIYTSRGALEHAEE